MNNIFLRSNNSIKNFSYYFIGSLIPLIIAGFYKNGIKLFNNDVVGLYGLIKPLLITILGFIIGSLVNLSYESYFRKSKDAFINKVFSSFHPVYGLLVASVISINTNIFLFILVTFICFFISKFIKDSRFNITALTALIIILLMHIFGDFSFLNIYEKTKVLNLTAIDYLMGLGSGGINTSFILLLLFSLIILGHTDFYKKSIPLYSFIAFSSLIVIYSLYKGNIESILDNIFYSGVLFNFVFLATDSPSSSYTKIGKTIYGILLGILTFIFFLIEPSLAALGGILIVSILHDFIDDISKKLLKQA